MKFEYKVVSIREIQIETGYLSTRALNRLGEQGWELVSIVDENRHSGEAIFKRQKEEVDNRMSTHSFLGEPFPR